MEYRDKLKHSHPWLNLTAIFPFCHSLQQPCTVSVNFLQSLYSSNINCKTLWVAQAVHSSQNSSRLGCIWRELKWSNTSTQVTSRFIGLRRLVRRLSQRMTAGKLIADVFTQFWRDVTEIREFQITWAVAMYIMLKMTIIINWSVKRHSRGLGRELWSCRYAVNVNLLLSFSIYNNVLYWKKGRRDLSILQVKDLSVDWGEYYWHVTLYGSAPCS